MFWALMEGAIATTLLVIGGEESLKALQTAGVLAGLLYIFLIWLTCVSIWRTLAATTSDYYSNSPSFAIGLFEPLASYPYKELIKNETKSSIVIRMGDNTNNTTGTVT